FIAEAPFGKDLPAVNAERPISVEQSLAAWLMSGAQIYAQAKYCGDRCRKAASRERISRDKNCEKTQKGSRYPYQPGRQTLADGVALVPGHELLLDRRNRRLQLLNLCRQHLQHLAPQIRQPRVALIADNRDQLAADAHARRRDHP